MTEAPPMIAPPEMPAEHGSVLDRIYASKRGSIVAESISPPVVVAMIDLGWLAWWPGKSRVTFTPEGASALGVRLNDRGQWISVRKRERSATQKPRKHETNFTSAGVDPNNIPDKHEPGRIDDGRFRRPTIIVGLTHTWSGPNISECPACGNVLYRNGRPYCCRCDGEPLARIGRAASAG